MFYITSWLWLHRTSNITSIAQLDIEHNTPPFTPPHIVSMALQSIAEIWLQEMMNVSTKMYELILDATRSATFQYRFVPVARDSSLIFSRVCVQCGCIHTALFTCTRCFGSAGGLQKVVDFTHAFLGFRDSPALTRIVALKTLQACVCNTLNIHFVVSMIAGMAWSFNLLVECSPPFT